MKTLNGQRIFVTGAAGFLGQHICKYLCGEGATVVATDVVERVELQCAHYLKMDVTNTDDVENTFNTLRNIDLFPDTVINNAAINPKIEAGTDSNFSRLENFDENMWDKEFEVGLKGAFLVSKWFLNGMINDRKKRNIINIASDLSVIAPNQKIYRIQGLDDNLQPVKPVTYSVIKHGLIGLTKYLATYYPELVRCNAISPAGFKNDQPTNFVKQLTDLIPVSRMADLTDLNPILSLLCDPGSEYLTGQNIVLDGGRTIW